MAARGILSKGNPQTHTHIPISLPLKCRSRKVDWSVLRPVFFAQGLAHIASLSSRARIPLPLTTLCALPFSFRRPRFVLSSHLCTLRISCVRRDGSSWLQQFCLYADWCGNERLLLEFCPPASVEIHSLKTGPTPENLSPWLKTYRNTTAWLASLPLALIE